MKESDMADVPFGAVSAGPPPVVRFSGGWHFTSRRYRIKISLGPALAFLSCCYIGHDTGLPHTVDRIDSRSLGMRKASLSYVTGYGALDVHSSRNWTCRCGIETALFV